MRFGFGLELVQPHLGLGLGVRDRVRVRVRVRVRTRAAARHGSRAPDHLGIYGGDVAEIKGEDMAEDTAEM